MPRGKVTGGSSAINGEIFLRGIPEDFDAWAALGNPEWSFARSCRSIAGWSTTSILAAPYHGQTGPIPVRRWPRDEWLPPQTAFYEACLAAGFADSPDHNAPDGVRRRGDSAQHRGRRPLEHAARLSQPGPRPLEPDDPVRHDGRAARVERTARDRRPGAPRVASPSVVEGGEIILSAGAVGSPHLLMLSGIGPADQLRQAGVAGPAGPARRRPEPARSSARVRDLGSRVLATRWTRSCRATRWRSATRRPARRCATTCRS